MECQTIDVYMYSRYSQRVEGIDLYGDPPCIRMQSKASAAFAARGAHTVVAMRASP